MCAAVFLDAEGIPLVADHYSEITPSSLKVSHEVCFRVKCDAEQAILRFQPADGMSLDVSDVDVAQVSREHVGRWSDSLYATVPRAQRINDHGKVTYLPETITKLKEGSRLRVVLLGDSILNDIGNSPFDVLLEREYPNAQVEVITEVDGGKGCWHFKDAERFRQSVTRHDPDLLILGGLSEEGDVDSIREVVGRVQSSLKAEIVLFSPVLGEESMYSGAKDVGSEPDGWDLDGYRSALTDLADSAQIAYFDLYAAWRSYVLGCGRPYDLFMRDDVHASERGRQVLARLVAGYLGDQGASCGLYETHA